MSIIMSNRPRRSALVQGSVLCLAALAAWTACGRVTPREANVLPEATEGHPAKQTPVSDTAAHGEAEEPALDQDARYRQLVLGTWEDDYKGHRTMTLCEDGTGTMVVELSGLQAALFAERLQFEMEWSLENGRLKKRTIGGEPATQVQLILKTMGDRVDEPILDLTEDRLLLLDGDGQTRYDWRRVR